MNERNLHLFTEALLGAVVTTRVENGVHVLRADLLKRPSPRMTPARNEAVSAKSFIPRTPAGSGIPPESGLYAAAALGLALWLASRSL